MVKNNDILSRFHRIPERDGRTDRIAVSISRVGMLTPDKNLLIKGGLGDATPFLNWRTHLYLWNGRFKFGTVIHYSDSSWIKICPRKGRRLGHRHIAPPFKFWH